MPAWESPPTRSGPLLRLRASVEGTFMSKCPHQSPRQGQEELSLLPGAGGTKRINKGREAQKHCLLKTTTPAYRRDVNPPQPGAEGPWRRNGGPFPF